LAMAVFGVHHERMQMEQSQLFIMDHT